MKSCGKTLKSEQNCLSANDFITLPAARITPPLTSSSPPTAAGKTSSSGPATSLRQKELLPETHPRGAWEMGPPLQASSDPRRGGLRADLGLLHRVFSAPSSETSTKSEINLLSDYKYLRSSCFSPLPGSMWALGPCGRKEGRSQALIRGLEHRRRTGPEGSVEKTRLLLRPAARSYSAAFWSSASTPGRVVDT